MINHAIPFVAIVVAIRQVTANPMPHPAPQAVTERIAPDLPPPAGCAIDFAGPFGLVVNPSAPQARVRRDWDLVTQIDDGQPQVVPGVTQIHDGQIQAPGHPVTQIHDGRIQAPGQPITQIHDGQIQAPEQPITQINDGQIQAPGQPITQIHDGQIQAPGQPVTQTHDGQIQAPGNPVTQIHDGQIQAPGQPITQIHDGQIQAPEQLITQIHDGQIQAPGHPVIQIHDGQIQAHRRQIPQLRQRVCSKDTALRLNLANGVLKDGPGRTGYIASNFQFQFDEPPQAGSIYTAGFSACEDGKLALGGSTVFYRCLSGDFYNIYDRWWADQCSPVTLDLAELIDC